MSHFDALANRAHTCYVLVIAYQSLFWVLHRRLSSSNARVSFSTVVAAVVLVLGGCAPVTGGALSPDTTFGNPEPVTLQGYTGPQEDPTLSPDGTILFFDSHNDAEKPTYQYWAKKIDYKTFAFQGEIQGANKQGETTFAATMDESGNLYLDTSLFTAPVLATARGTFKNGTVIGAGPVKGLPTSPALPWGPNRIIDVYFGEITFDGNSLYLDDFQVKTDPSGHPANPVGGKFKLFTKNQDGSFREAANSDNILERVNALSPGKILYGAVQSKDGLELFFTGSDVPSPSAKKVGLYVAKRGSTNEPFGTPEEIGTPSSHVEAPFPSPDGKHLYFHELISASESQLYVETRQ